MGINLFSILIITLILCHVSHAANILLVVGNHKSHIMYFGHLGKSLSRSGNHVTATIGSGMKVLPEFKSGDIEWLTYRMSKSPVTYDPKQVKALVEAGLGNMSFLEKMKTMKSFFLDFTAEAEELYSDHALVEKLLRKKFDFIVLDCSIMTYYLIPYVLDVPFACFSLDIEPFAARMPVYPSYVPSIVTGLYDRMTFLERVINFVAYYTFPVILPLVVTDNGREKFELYVADKEPRTFKEMSRNASLYFTLRQPFLSTIRGSMPNVIDIGGVMGRPSQLNNIPEDIKNFIEGSPNGFILVSFGSWLDSFPDDILNKLVKAMSLLDQRVLFKISSEPKTKPNNVKFVKWMPQNDILGHPAIKAFVMHCGVSSMIETTYHGIPIVGFPIGMDQSINANLLRNRKTGIILDITKFTVNELVQAIQDVSVEGNEYRANAMKLSAIVGDLPNAGETASFWINHVVKNGGHHLRSAAYELAWYQYLNLDVIAVILFVMYCVVKLTSLCCRKCCCGRICRRKPKEKKE